MSAPRVFDIDVAEFSMDPYPVYKRLRAEAPIAFVPQLGSILLTRRDDIFLCEKNIAVFSSHQPHGLMTRLMGENMMRKDGEAHLAERRAAFPALSPQTAVRHWRGVFEGHARRILDELAPLGSADLCENFALPFSAECLKSITGLANITYREMDDWSRGMIDGIANYGGDPAVEARCHAATEGIDAAIDDRLSAVRAAPDPSLLSVLVASGMPLENVRANIKLAISGGQNEPRHAILGSIFALLAHQDQLQAARAGAINWAQIFEEYVRWMSPIGMSPRRVARPHVFNGVEFKPDDRVFLMFASANRDEAHFDDADAFNARRNQSKSMPFGAGPHFCAGAGASRTMVADVALPMLFSRIGDLRLADGAAPTFEGWAFRGLRRLDCVWTPC